MYEQMKKNTVDSSNQLKKSEYVYLENPEGKGLRVMFAGNSITLHGVKEDIGWMNRWGMAASALEKDYVHILMNKISQKYEDATFCICQVAQWEREYKNGETVYDCFRAARDFSADVIIARFVENCKLDDFDPESFKREYSKFLNYLNASGKAKIILTGGFWKHPADEIISEIAKDRGYPYVELGDLGERDDMRATGLFEHAGVAAHPGDKGMANIAERIWQSAEKVDLTQAMNI